jgi:DNA-binding transcriptional MerR regulator
MAAVELPNRSLFKAPEVCEIAQLQPYVLRSWEAEFPDLGVTRAGSAGRVYRRHDVERVLRLKHLLFVEGLTLAGARRRLEEESAPLPALDDEGAGIAAGERHGREVAKADRMLRQHLEKLQQGLRGLLDMLEQGRPSPAGFHLKAQAPAVASKAQNAAKPSAKAPKVAKGRK